MAAVGEPVAFDGSGSSDDQQAPTELDYSWDFGDGSDGAIGQAASHAYSAAGVYTATLTVTDAEGLSDTDVIEVTVGGGGGADLRVTAIETVQNTGSGGTNGQPKAGDKVLVNATVSNVGAAEAGPSTTSFALDGQPMAGSPISTAAIPAGESVVVSVTWDTRGLKDDHVITVTADGGGAVEEADEANNASSLEVAVKGNKVTNGDFSEPNSAGDGPEGWTETDTEAGDATWSENGTDGSRAATTEGNGGNALLAGVPAWTSDPIAVVAGEALTLRVSVSSLDPSSTASVGLAYLGAAGELLGSVQLLDVPSFSGGFQVLELIVDGAGRGDRPADRPDRVQPDRHVHRRIRDLRRRRPVRAIADRRAGTPGRASAGSPALVRAGPRRPLAPTQRQLIGSGLPSTGQRKSAAASRTRVSSPLATYACNSDQLVTRVDGSPPVHVAR